MIFTATLCRAWGPATGKSSALGELGRRTRDGRPYENECIAVFTVEDGRIRAVREYMDTLYAHDTVFV